MKHVVVCLKANMNYLIYNAINSHATNFSIVLLRLVSYERFLYDANHSQASKLSSKGRDDLSHKSIDIHTLRSIR